MGFAMPSGGWFRNTDQPAPAEIKAVEKFAVLEWAVVPKHRGKGVGRTLMQSLLDGRHEPFAALTVNPAAETRAIYERVGWRRVAATHPSRNWPAMDVVVLNRTEKRS